MANKLLQLGLTLEAELKFETRYTTRSQSSADTLATTSHCLMLTWKAEKEELLMAKIRRFSLYYLINVGYKYDDFLSQTDFLILNSQQLNSTIKATLPKHHYTLNI
jgi:hypothetical protein